MNRIDPKYLSPTKIMDCENQLIIDFEKEITHGTADPVERAVRLYYAVRDGIWYDPYSPFYLPEHYLASGVLKKGRGYCVAKATLLCALGRAAGIPSRLGFATVRNHLATRQLLAYLGSDLFVYHGFTEFYLDGRWVKATPAFNRELCTRHHVPPLEFNGREDSIFHSYNLEEKRFMEYIDDLGTFVDVPVEAIVKGWEKAYGAGRVRGWIEAHESAGGDSGRDFTKEDVLIDK